MSAIKKLITGAAGAAGGGDPVYIEDVFSIATHDGNGGSLTVTNNIDLSTEGGLVWVKSRTSGDGHALMDTERGGSSRMNTANTGGADTAGATTFNTDGFTLSTSNGNQNGSGKKYASYSFRKAPSFFDCITYTGDGSSSRSISHNLGSIPHFIVVKRVSAAAYWAASHWDQNGTRKILTLNTTDAVNVLGTYSAGYVHSRNSSTFTVLANNTTDMDAVNKSGETYVAYLFAHNDGDGVFGENSDQDIIRCGSVGADNGAPTNVNLGFEAQWVLFKNLNSTEKWYIYDVMRGMAVDGSGFEFYTNSDVAESERTTSYVKPHPNGFTLEYPSGSDTIIYVAIRRGPMKVPEDATNVFYVQYKGVGEGSDTFISTGFPVDTFIYGKLGGSPKVVGDRLRGRHGGGDLITTGTNAEASNTGAFFLTHHDGVTVDASGGHFNAAPAATDESYARYFWGRAPSFYDVATWTGQTNSVTSIPHNLGAIPEMIWVKGRDNSLDWIVVGSVLGGSESKDNYILLNSTNSMTSFPAYRDANDTTTTFGIRKGNGYWDNTGTEYIAYLFATLDGVSKVGSYTGNAQETTIDCGFSTGARFIMFKRTDSTGDWTVFDVERGWSGSTDYWIDFNNTASQQSGNALTVRNAGFGLRSSSFDAAGLNVSGATYIFYAIA